MRRQTIGYFVFLFVATIVLGEITVRALGYRPGILISPETSSASMLSLENISNAELLPHFYGDSLGVLKVNTQFEVKKENNLTKLLEPLREVKLNSDGFRTGEPNSIKFDKPRVVFLGDSYTFGFDAQPFTQAFPDKVSEINQKLEVFNLGVPGADMLSYSIIAQHYLDRYKPDIVVLSLYVNDLVPFDKSFTPNSLNTIFPTTSGIFYKAVPTDNRDMFISFNNAKASTDYISTKFTTYNHPNPAIKWVCGQSAFATIAYTPFYDYKQYLDSSSFSIFPKKNYTPKHFQSISTKCEELNADLIVCLIPDKNGTDKKSTLSYFRTWLEDSTTVLNYPERITSKHYGSDYHTHFDNSGHAVFADFVNSLILKSNKYQETPAD